MSQAVLEPPEVAAGVGSGTDRHRRQLPGRKLGLGLVYVVSGLFYVWTGQTAGVPRQVGSWGDPYNELTDGFLHGHLYLDLAVPPALKALADPWNPATNDGFSSPPYHDLAYFHGHFYSTWGPTPVFTLYLPWRILHLGLLPMNIAVEIYGVVGLGFALALFVRLVDRYLSGARTWQVLFGAVALGWLSVVPYLLRRPAFYEVAISCSYAFACAGAYFLLSGWLGGGRASRYLLGSLCLGLAAGGHIDVVLIGIALPLVFLAERRRSKAAGRAMPRQLAVVLGGPFAVILAVLGWYNWARFGSPFQFGTIYQLASVDPHNLKLFQLGYVVPGLFYYFLAPVRLSLAFPYVFLAPPPSYPFGVPAVYSLDPVSGILATSPILLALLAWPLALRRRAEAELWWIGTTFVVAGGLIAIAVSVGIWGATMRYETDFATWLLLGALLTWLVCVRNARARWRWLANGAAGVAIAFGVFVATGASLTGDNAVPLEWAPPGTLQPLQSATSALPTVVSMLEGRPEMTELFAANGYAGILDPGTFVKPAPPAVYLTLAPSEIDVICPSSGTLSLSGVVYGGYAPSGYSGPFFVSVENTGRATTYAITPGQRFLARIAVRRGLDRIDVSGLAPTLSGIGSTTPLVVLGDLGVAGA